MAARRHMRYRRQSRSSAMSCNLSPTTHLLVLNRGEILQSQPILLQLLQHLTPNVKSRKKASGTNLPWKRPASPSHGNNKRRGTLAQQ